MTSQKYVDIYIPGTVLSRKKAETPATKEELESNILKRSSKSGKPVKQDDNHD